MDLKHYRETNELTKWIEQIVWIEFQLQSWLFIVQMIVFSTFELIFLTQLNYYSSILSLLPMLSISISLSYKLAFEVVVCKKTKLQTQTLWMKSNDCKFGCVNIANFISVKNILQADFVSVDSHYYELYECRSCFCELCESKLCRCKQCMEGATTTQGKSLDS